MAEEKPKLAAHEFSEEQIEGNTEILYSVELNYFQNSRMLTSSLICLVKVSSHGIKYHQSADASDTIHSKVKSVFYLPAVTKTNQQPKKILKLK